MEELADVIFTCAFIVEAKRPIESLETFYRNKRCHHSEDNLKTIM
jgi:hypothetical protein